MFGLVVALLIIALIAGILGFGGIAGAADGLCENRLLCGAGIVGCVPGLWRSARGLRQAPLTLAWFTLMFLESKGLVWECGRTADATVRQSIYVSEQTITIRFITADGIH